LPIVIASSPDLQAKGELASLSWMDATTGPRDQPVWASTCKSEAIDPVDDLDYLHRFSIVKGVAVAVGTGTHKHIARNAAATDALKSLVEINNHG
jgi:hypothetical protein